MKEYLITPLDENNFEIVTYKITRTRCHHKNGFKSVCGERISIEILDSDTLLKRYQKGLADFGIFVILP
jgi:hypothetical protein